jgi:hypothetical protein
MTLLKLETKRRMEQIPKLRPADQIDVTEEQLQLIKDIFDCLPKVDGYNDCCGSIDFFMTIRKDPRVRAIGTAIAREPDGESRLPKESFN